MSRPTILTVLCGNAPSTIASSHGDYLAWFQEGLGERVELVPWDILKDDTQPPLEGHAGIVITGTPASLTKPEPWMEVAVECIRSAAESKIPLFGVCFGHQLVGCAFGAPTVLAAGDGEHGSLPVTLTSAGREDPLFKGFPDSFEAQLTHYDKVEEQAVAYSNGLRILASSSHTPIQALAAGDYIRSVQFHPEFSREVMASYLEADGIDPALAHECPEATSVFQRWLDHWVFGES